ncbi:MAG TPA: tRNA preQ1(34) S-adenosylmethionine ribosyltransferase-isomerase QueA [Actinobacteria bacterium]|nr:tRNA preQ1(34) S-adenosylmethionine ribosyltransferase-isomerase QueA [Actinomycetota bacterium]
MLTSDFRYDLPERAIAQSAIEPRHAARLLDTRTMGDRVVADLPSLLTPGDLVVVNSTRVRRARLAATKDSGGAVEVLLLRPHTAGSWQALVRPRRRVRRGTRLTAGPVVFEVGQSLTDGVVVLKIVGGSVEEAVASVGTIPLPPYFHGELTDPERYQTVYALREASAAAPTAGLHFTPELIAALEGRNIMMTAVDLEIGLDTFRPIAAERITDHAMHQERVIVGEEAVSAIAATRAGGGRVVAIGTTVVRSLESAAAGGALRPFDGVTDLFITPGYRFQVVDVLVTNFHVPGSTLIVLVAAFMGSAWREAYTTALGRGYRFLSFGDAMLAERRP